MVLSWAAIPKHAVSVHRRRINASCLARQRATATTAAASAAGAVTTSHYFGTCAAMKRNADNTINLLGNSHQLILRPISQQSHNTNNSSLSSSFWMLGSLAVAAVSATTTSTNATRNDPVLDEKTNNDDDDSEEEEEVDPYDNLPDEDEPTHCSICNTYRQGPCRPYWRKVERCTKDNEIPAKKKKVNEDDEDDYETTTSNDDPPICMKYMMPWIECATGYRGLYALIELDTNYTMGIADLEDETNKSNQVVCWNPHVNSQDDEYQIDVDWTQWQNYVQVLTNDTDEKKELKKKPTKDDETIVGWVGPTALVQQQKQTKTRKTTSSSTSTKILLEPSSVNAKGNSLWKTLDVTKPSDDPVLIPIEATIPRIEGDGVGILECAYALDQMGNVLGFVYGSHGSSTTTTTTTLDDDDDESDTTGSTTTKKERTVPTVTLTIRLMPSHTSHITIGASYVRPGPEEDEEQKDKPTKKGEDKDSKEKEDKSMTRLYKCQPLSLLEHSTTKPTTN